MGPFGWLEQVASGARVTRMHVDALGELARVNDAELFWDTGIAQGRPLEVDGDAVLSVVGFTGTPSGWDADGWRTARPTGTDPWAAALGSLGAAASGVSVGPGGQVGVAGLAMLGARVYDPMTRGFLSPDPLPPVTGVAWGGNPYSYAGNDPLHALDPSGLRPVTDAELQAYRDSNNGALAAAGDWIASNWEYVAGAAMVIAGGVMMATGVGGPAGLALISMGADTIIQKATTGSVESPANARITIDDVGNVNVQGDNVLFLNFGDGPRAETFLQQRLDQGFDGTQVKAFDVPDSYADSIRSRAVPETNAKGNPVFQVDTTKTDSSYGLRASEFPALEGAAIPGSGRVIAP